jgi:hypothetical protein
MYGKDVVKKIGSRGPEYQGKEEVFGSPGRDRTYDKSINSRLLYR